MTRVLAIIVRNRKKYLLTDAGEFEATMLPEGVVVPPEMWAEIEAVSLDKPEAVPEEVSRLQALVSLEDMGLLAQVEQAISQAPRKVQLAWANATVFRRDSPTLGALAQKLNLTPTQLDTLFINAASVQA